MVRGLTPRTERTSCVTAHDAYLMAFILKEEPVHLPAVMMKHMESCAQSKSHGLLVICESHQTVWGLCYK